jgi:hypothetical protein
VVVGAYVSLLNIANIAADKDRYTVGRFSETFAPHVIKAKHTPKHYHGWGGGGSEKILKF